MKESFLRTTPSSHHSVLGDDPVDDITNELHWVIIVVIDKHFEIRFLVISPTFY